MYIFMTQCNGERKQFEENLRNPQSPLLFSILFDSPIESNLTQFHPNNFLLKSHVHGFSCHSFLVAILNFNLMFLYVFTDISNDLIWLALSWTAQNWTVLNYIYMNSIHIHLIFPFYFHFAFSLPSALLYF